MCTGESCSLFIQDGFLDVSKQPFCPCVVFSVRGSVSSIFLTVSCVWRRIAGDPPLKASGSPHSNPSDPQTPRKPLTICKGSTTPWGTFAPVLFVCGKGRLLVKLSQCLKQHRAPCRPATPPHSRPLLNNCTMKADADFLLCTFPWKTESGGFLPHQSRGASWVLCGAV